MSKLLSIAFILLLIAEISISQNVFEFYGKAKLDGDSQKGIKIVVTKNGQAYKTYTPESNGRYSFNLDFNNVYVVSYVRNNYVTKKVEVNTNVPAKVLEKNSYKSKWKVEVGLFREYEGLDFSFFDKPIQKIFYVNKSVNFNYDNSYAKQIEAELKALMKEIDKKKAEEAKQAEKDKQEALEKSQQEAKQRIKDEKIANAKKLEEQNKAAVAQREANKQAEKLAKDKAREQAQQELEQRQANKQKQYDEDKRKREEQEVAEKKALADRLAAAQADEDERKAKTAKAFAEAEERKAASKAKAAVEAEERRKKFDAIKQAHQDELKRKHTENRTEKSYEEQGKKITEITIVRDDVVDVYRMVTHNWGGVYYFKNEKSISKQFYFKETLE